MQYQQTAGPLFFS